MPVTTLGVIFPPDLPPERLRPVAAAADESGLEQLWIWEDCFKESGIATACAALAWTERVVLGIGLLPVPLRNVALTAMELGTAERLFPGRVVAGVGHGVLDWMDQVGARAESPMTLLREYAYALRELLHGRSVTVSGRYVRLTDVALDWPPAAAPPLLVGAVRSRTVALAGELADGVIFTGETSPEQLRDAMAAFRAGRDSAAADVQPAASAAAGQVVVYLPVPGHPAPGELAQRIDEYAAAGATHVALLAVGDAPPLEQFVRFVATEVRPLVP